MSKPRKTICALQSIGMGRVSRKLDRRAGPLCSPAVPALPVISWMNGSVVWCCLRMAQVSSCNGPSIARRNSSVGEKEKGLPKKGALKPGMLLLRVAPWRDSQAGGELARKMPIKESKECLAPRCFDPVFKDAPWASSSSARQSPRGASPGVYGHCRGCGTARDSVGRGRAPAAAHVSVPCRPQPTYEINAGFFWLQTQPYSLWIWS